MKGMGIDAVAINRFADWHEKPLHQLQKIFTPQEIEYCLKDHQKSAERFAVRFAAKEATLKALQSLYPEKRLSFFACAKTIEIIQHHTGMPVLILKEHPSLKTLISLTHTHDLAFASIIIY